MKRTEKSLLAGAALVAGLFIFVPETYVWVSKNVGKAAKVIHTGGK